MSDRRYLFYATVVQTGQRFWFEATSKIMAKEHLAYLESVDEGTKTYTDMTFVRRLTVLEDWNDTAEEKRAGLAPVPTPAEQAMDSDISHALDHALQELDAMIEQATESRDRLLAGVGGKRRGPAEYLKWDPMARFPFRGMNGHYGLVDPAVRAERHLSTAWALIRARGR